MNSATSIQNRAETKNIYYNNKDLGDAHSIGQNVTDDQRAMSKEAHSKEQTIDSKVNSRTTITEEGQEFN